MDWYVNLSVLPFIALLVLALLWFGRKHLRHLLSGLWSDAQDFIFSMIDEPLDPIMDVFGITAPIPWEPGDLWAAIRTFRRERHVMGKFFAQVAAFECLAFGIEPLLEMVPGGSIIAAPIGWFFNILPTTTILRFITRYKMKKAEKGLHEIDHLASTEKELELGVDKDLKTDVKGLTPMERKGYWEDMNKWLAETGTERKKAWKKIRQRVDEELSVAADALAAVGEELRAWQEQLAFASEQFAPEELQPFHVVNVQVLELLEQARTLITKADKIVPRGGVLGLLSDPDPRNAITAVGLARDAVATVAAAESELREASAKLAAAMSPAA
ncbi:hypothetical protein D6789_00345 [Candidatus Woesearchaeota archaeon]|nr:MAG: hypothetical protein D6789_00345 [Candidatus Woesearchaeota archaeon]